MEPSKEKMVYQKPSWRKQEVLENFAMQGTCKQYPARAGCCPNPKS
jgi:hypothetical protein